MTIHALAPASTANLGPGFDAAAAALDLWNEAVVEEVDEGPVVEIEGEGADELAADAAHLTASRLRARRCSRPVQVPFRQPHPARARPRVERGGDRDRPRCRCGGLRPRDLSGRAARTRRTARGPRGQPCRDAARWSVGHLEAQRCPARRADRLRPAADPGDRGACTADEHRTLAQRPPVDGQSRRCGGERRTRCSARRGDRLGRCEPARRRVLRPPARAVPRRRRAPPPRCCATGRRPALPA